MWCKHEKLHLNLSSMYISANTIKHHGNQDIEQTMLVLSLLLNFGLCLPISGRQSPNTQIMIYRLDTTSLVIVVLDRMSCFGRTILISAESRIFLPKYSYFCRNMTISAFLPNPIFEPESLFRQANQKNIRPNYSAESLLGRTLQNTLIGKRKLQGQGMKTLYTVNLFLEMTVFLSKPALRPALCQDGWDAALFARPVFIISQFAS